MFAQARKGSHILLAVNNKENEKEYFQGLKASFSLARGCKIDGALASGLHWCEVQGKAQLGNAKTANHRRHRK